MTEIENTLHLFGIGPSYYGYRPMILSVNMVLGDEDRLRCASSSIYPAVVEHFGGSQAAAERNMRTIANRAWIQNRALLERIAGRTFEKPPSTKLFIEILYIHITRQK